MTVAHSNHARRIIWIRISGTSVCNGDSGGGMYFENDGIYSLRGIVSLTVARSAEANICNPQEYVLFTDAARYLDWIRINSE